MKILVTGGSGYIGSRLMPLLSGHSVYSLDQNPPEGAGFIKGDIRDEALQLSDFDVIFHLAAISLPRQAEEHSDKAWDVNVNGTLNICKKLGKGQRLIFMSSAQVYDRTSGEKHTETEIPAPSGLYGLTKLVGEDIVRYYSAKNSFHHVILRLFNAYSKDQPPGLLVGDVIDKYKNLAEVEIINPDTVLDMVHVDDVVKVLQGSMDFKDGSYNLCSGHPLTIRDIYGYIRDYLKAETKPEKIVSRSRHSLTGDNSKLASLGYTFRPFSLSGGAK